MELVLLSRRPDRTRSAEVGAGPVGDTASLKHTPVSAEPIGLHLAVTRTLVTLSLQWLQQMPSIFWKSSTLRESCPISADAASSWSRVSQAPFQHGHPCSSVGFSQGEDSVGREISLLSSKPLEPQVLFKILTPADTTQ